MQKKKIEEKKKPKSVAAWQKAFRETNPNKKSSHTIPDDLSIPEFLKRK